MIEFAEGIVTASLSTIIYKIVSDRLLNRKKPDTLGALPWSILRHYTDQYGRSEGWGFQCPKCESIKANQFSALNICSCLEYPKEHYHFSCKNCSFKSLLRTADDK